MRALAQRAYMQDMAVLNDTNALDRTDKTHLARIVFFVFLLTFMLAGRWSSCGLREPVYAGKRLSVWADEVRKLDRLANVVNTNHPAVQAMRAIGTNAIPWLLSELRKPPNGWSQLNPFLEKQTLITYRFPVPADAQKHQLCARCGFWALGEMAEPAVPSLVGLLDRQPEFAPSALAGIGAPALPAIMHLLTNNPPHVAADSRHASGQGNAISGLYVAINLGRISRSEAAYLLPAIQAWEQQTTNAGARYWAHGVLSEFKFER